MTTATLTARRVISCDECRTPVAEVREQGILVKSRHQGTTHVTLIPWALLRALIEQAAEQRAA